MTRSAIEQTARRRAIAEACRDIQDAARRYARAMRTAARAMQTNAAANLDLPPDFQDEDDAGLAFVLSLQRLDRVLDDATRRGDGFVKTDAAGWFRVVRRLAELLTSPASVKQPNDARDFGTAASVWERLVRDETARWPPEERQDVKTLARAILDEPAAPSPAWSTAMSKTRLAEVLGLTVDTLTRLYGSKLRRETRKLWRIRLDLLDAGDRHALENAPLRQKAKPRGRTKSPDSL